MTRSLAITYSQEQIDEYFSFIGFHDRRNLKSSAENNVAFLNSLIKAQLRSIPFENLDIHFSKSRTICLNPEYLFNKFINPGNHRGGYCLENNLFFGIVLRSLGFEVLSVGGRVNRAAVSVDARCDGVGSPFRGWGHMCNIVVVGGLKYLVDVGFGNNAPTCAVLLKEHYSCRNTGDDKGGSSVRISREQISETSGACGGDSMWVYSFKFAEEMDWIPGYCFSELEFLAADYEVMNFYTSQNPASFFVKNVVVSKVIFDDTEQAVGDLTLFNGRVKERRNGQSRIVCEARGEPEILEALFRYFGIVL